jgi:glycosyltransferase involved in cell wall biosynthesis
LILWRDENLPVKVLHLRDTDRICGPGKTMLETACRIDQSRFLLDIGVFVRSEDEPNQYVNAVRARGVVSVPVEMQHMFDLNVVERIASLIERHEYAILHTHEYKSDLIGRLVARRVGVKLVSTCHGWIRNTVKSQLLAALQKHALRGFHRVIAVSPQIQSELSASGIAEDKLELVYNAIVSDDYKKNDWTFGSFRDQLGLSPNTFLVGYIGRLSVEKGQRDFLHAIVPVLESNHSIHVVFVGDGPDEQQLKVLTSDLGLVERVTFAGFRTVVQPIIRDLDGLALTSRTEGFPNVVMEAMCMQVPVIATDVGGTSALVEELKTGRLIPAMSNSAIANTVSWLVNNRQLADQLSVEGYRKVVSTFDFSTRCRRMEHIYEDIMGGR